MTEISTFPVTAMAGMPLALNGFVVPMNATNKAIVFSVNDAGTTGATTISGNILNTLTEGSVTITATIKDGVTAGTDYKLDFYNFTARKPLPFRVVDEARSLFCQLKKFCSSRQYGRISTVTCQ